MGRLLMVLSVLLVLSGVALAGDYQYLDAAAVKEKIESQAPLLLVDIQVEEEFAAHHLPGALATYAFPVKSDEERNKLEAAVTQAKAGDDPVVIVCPRGGGGAQRTYDCLKDQGVDEGRLFILEKGQQGWPYAELTLRGE